MNTRLLWKRYAYVLLIMITSIVLSACTSKMLSGPESSFKGVKTSSDKVLVINSNRSVERYQIAEAAFIGGLISEDLAVVDLQEDDKPIEIILDVLNQQQFDLIYAIGAKALGSVSYIDPAIPVVYSTVLNWRRFKQQHDFFGISSELSSQAQLTWFKYIFPEIRKVGVLYSDENGALIEEAHLAAQNLSLELVSYKVRGNRQLTENARQLFAEVDALWLISDSKILSSIEQVNALFALTHEYQVPVLTYNPLFIEMGATLSLAADLPTIGVQAAIIANEWLAGQKPDELLQFPAGSRIMLNSQKVREYDLKLNPFALESVDEIFP